jgi:hypothetical protein
MHIKLNNSLGKWDVREGEIKHMPSPLCCFSKLTNEVYSALTHPLCKLSTLVGCFNSWLKHIMLGVKVPSYKTFWQWDKVSDIF